MFKKVSPEDKEKKIAELEEYKAYLYKMWERENDLYMEGLINGFSCSYKHEIARVNKRIEKLCR